jgi:hypothetical protein
MKIHMKHIIDHIAAAQPIKVRKAEPKFKLVKPSPALNGGSATTDVIR